MPLHAMHSALPGTLQHATAFIDRDALVANLSLARACAPGAAQLCMIKANAYGHGMLESAEALQPHCEYFGVARMSEAIQLREHGIVAPVVLFSQSYAPSDFRLARELDLLPVLYAESEIDEQLALCNEYNLRFWVKLDTGMHRLGLPTDSAALRAALASARCDTVLTHLHSAEEADSSAATQLQAFFDALQRAAYCGKQNISVANSALLLRSQLRAQQHPDNTVQGYQALMQQFHRDYSGAKDIARPGIMLYGADPLPAPNACSAKLQAVMSFCAPVIDLRKLPAGASVGYGASWRASRASWIATVAVGYGDGYPRHAPSGTPVLVNGHRAELAGRVSMDSIGVDVTDAIAAGQRIEVGDPALLWGRDLPVEQVASCAGTISYQLLTGVSPRVQRVYR